MLGEIQKTDRNAFAYFAVKYFLLIKFTIYIHTYFDVRSIEIEISLEAHKYFSLYLRYTSIVTLDNNDNWIYRHEYV